MELNMILTLAGGLVVLGVLGAAVLVTKRTAYLGPVKEELQKEKMWLRRGEYNAAMVKGRQNLELLLKLVAEKNGIQLDNTAQAVANAREEMENQKGAGKRGGRGKEKKIMTHHQFNRWLSENGYLDRVAKWEMNQVRLIGNKAVHENYADKDDAWNQFNYLEDILKTVSEKSQNPKKHHERKGAEAKEGQKAESGQKAKNGQKAEGGQKAKNAQKTAQKPENGEKPVKAKKKQTAEIVQSPSTAAVSRLEAVEAASGVNAQDPEMQEQKKRKRRRRRSKKPSEGSAATAAVDVETVVPVEEKATDQKDTAPSDDTAKAKKRRRRRHGSKKPQTDQNIQQQVAPDMKPQADQSKKPKNDQNKKNAEKALAKRSAVSAEHPAQKVQNAQNVQKEQNAEKVQKVQEPQETQMPKTDDAAKKKHRRRRRRPKSQADGQTNRPENGQAAAGKLVPEDKHEIV